MTLCTSLLEGTVARYTKLSDALKKFRERKGQGDELPSSADTAKTCLPRARGSSSAVFVSFGKTVREVPVRSLPKENKAPGSTPYRERSPSLKT